MFGMSGGELLIIAAIALVVIGPERLPQATRTMGQMYARVRREAENFRRALVQEADRVDEEDRLKELRRKRMEAQLERERKLAEGQDDGTRAQPDPAAARQTPPTDLEEPAPGFTAAEWADIPPHIRAIVKNRRPPEPQDA